ncbi:Transaldolase [Candidatus Tremblaya phenacola]|uniref:Transaldolase n=2 Tax=Candidatus Tremblayella phenacoccinincola TaxID=1010676 RepID=A0A2G0V793_9PROT|nr:Transaldolase [Candidatus Tremblaya phenacola]
MNMNALEYLKKYTTVALDSGNFLEVAKLHPNDVTTNPSLILKATKDKECLAFIDGVISTYKAYTTSEIINQILVHLGNEILKYIPGTVSIELNADYAFNVEESMEQIAEVLMLCNSFNIQDRVLIKVPATWEGIQVLRLARKKNVRCNMTLVFSLAQAVLCGESKAYLISPFVGRVSDMYTSLTSNCKKQNESLDVGVQFLEQVYQYFKHNNYNTKLMAASFRSIEQALSVTGCDYVTLSPDIFLDLKNTHRLLPTSVLSVSHIRKQPIDLKPIWSQEFFYRALKQNVNAYKNLINGVYTFRKATQELTQYIEKRVCVEC